MITISRFRLSSPYTLDDMEPGSIFSELSGSSAEDRFLIQALQSSYASVQNEWSNPCFLRNIEINGLFLMVPKANCSVLKPEESQLLLAVQELQKRVAIFVQTPEKLQKATRLRTGTVVDCCLPRDSSVGTDFRGTVKWIGQLKFKYGTYFGVELMAPGAGDSDGSLSGVRYFQSKENQAVFVGMDKLKLVNLANSPRMAENRKKVGVAKQDRLDAALSVGRSHFYTDLDKWSDKVLCKGTGEQDDEFVDWIKVEDSLVGEGAPSSSPQFPSLRLGDRIVWINTEGRPEYGTVRWIGLLPGGRDDWYAGIEFDNPIGGGTGRYHGRELFCTKPNHASLVPVIGLIRAQDFSPYDPRSKKPQSHLEQISQEQTRSSSHSDKSRSETRKFSLATCVEVTLSDSSIPRYGVVKFFGNLPVGPKRKEMVMAGIELEEDLPVDWGLPTDGYFEGKQYFSSAPRRGIFVPATQLRPDQRFNTTIMSMHEFGSLDSGVISEYQPPKQRENWSHLSTCGKHRGIQGHKNSCYLDATLFAMFSHTNAFDRLLLRPENPSDIKEYVELRDFLATEIVYPLRRNNFVRADHIVRFRQLLSRLLPDIAGLTEDEKDPEELLNALLGRLLKTEPYLQLWQNGKLELANLFQLINYENQEPSLGFKLPTVQQLLENSFFHSGVKLKRIPPCLIVQLPRYGREKIYQWIVPLLSLDLTHVMKDSPRPCRDCKKLAEFECRECYLIGAQSLADVSFCSTCFDLTHRQLPNQTNDHCPTMITYSQAARSAVTKTCLPIPSVKLELVSVLCIETSHYVAFSRVGDSSGGSWVLCDSMADRKGASEGYNIPEVSSCPEIGKWLAPQEFQELRLILDNGRTDCIPRYLQRLLKDCYICFYVWPDAELYGARTDAYC